MAVTSLLPLNIAVLQWRPTRQGLSSAPCSISRFAASTSGLESRPCSKAVSPCWLRRFTLARLASSAFDQGPNCPLRDRDHEQRTARTGSAVFTSMPRLQQTDRQRCRVAVAGRRNECRRRRLPWAERVVKADKTHETSSLRTIGIDAEQAEEVGRWWHRVKLLPGRYPFSLATSSATWRTRAGWFSLPRCGTGAR
jgi:hypothetical protein